MSPTLPDSQSLISLLVPFALGMVVSTVIHESLHWLPGRVLGWEPYFGLDKILKLPLTPVTRYHNSPSKHTAMNFLKLILVSYLPLLLIPVGILLTRVGFFAFGMGFVAFNVANIPVEVHYTAKNVRELLFPDYKKLVSWAGLAPSLHQSGNVEYHGSITKQGSKMLRWIMVEAATVAVNHDARMRGFYERVKHRRGPQKAIIAVSNKMLKITWFMLTRREPYESRNEKRYQQKLNSIAS